MRAADLGIPSVPADLRLDAADIEARGLLHHPKGRVKSRLGGMASLHFTDGWMPATRHAILSILEDYLGRFGDGIARFKLAQDKRMRPYSGQGIPAQYRDAAVIGDEDALFYVHMMSDGDGDSDPCRLRFLALGNPLDRLPRGRPLSGLKMHLPAAFLLETPDEAHRLLSDWAGRLPIAHGTAGLAALSEPGAEDQGACWWPWLEAHPGLDYDAMGSYWSELRRDTEQLWRPRASNWLTFLGPRAVDALGGHGAVPTALDRTIELSTTGRTLVLRASPSPVLGSAATGGVPEGWRSVARLIRPIRFEAYRHSVIRFPDRPDRTTHVAAMLAWLGRFD